MNKILILFAHPALEKSRVHMSLLKSISKLPGVTLNDLYQQYPDFDIDIEREQQLLKGHDIVVWQHPFYWYSAPALLKQWEDLVLEHGWAYGRNGHELKGKKIFNAFSSGASMNAYHMEGSQHCTITDLLRPFERTAWLCRMTYLPPFWIPGSHRLDMVQIQQYCIQYRELLIALRDGTLSEEDALSMSQLNEFNGVKNII
jgi:glutathione-regulated potassium-efflux system ancillary protein KefG